MYAIALAASAYQAGLEPIAVLVGAKGAVEVNCVVTHRTTKPGATWTKLHRGDKVACGSSGSAKIFEGKFEPCGKFTALGPGASYAIQGDYDVFTDCARRKLNGLGKAFGVHMGGGDDWLLPFDGVPVALKGLTLRATSERAAKWTTVNISQGSNVLRLRLSSADRAKISSPGGYAIKLPTTFKAGASRIECLSGNAVDADRKFNLVEASGLSSLTPTNPDLALEAIGTLYEQSRFSELFDLLVAYARAEPANGLWQERLIQLAESKPVSLDAVRSLLPNG